MVDIGPDMPRSAHVTTAVLLESSKDPAPAVSDAAGLERWIERQYQLGPGGPLSRLDAPVSTMAEFRERYFFAGERKGVRRQVIRWMAVKSDYNEGLMRGSAAHRRGELSEFVSFREVVPVESRETLATHHPRQHRGWSAVRLAAGGDCGESGEEEEKEQEHDPEHEHSDHAHVHAHQGMPSTGTLFQKPRARLYWNHERTKAIKLPAPHSHAWMELFFDLIYVASLLKLSAILKAELSWATLFLSLGVWLTLYNNWSQFTLFHARFEISDEAHSLLLVLYTMTVLFMCASICEPPLHYDGLYYFFLFTVLSRAFFVVLNCSVATTVVGKVTGQHACVVPLLECASMLPVMYEQNTLTYFIWGFVAVVAMPLHTLSYRWLTLQGKETLPLDLPHIIGRFAELVMLVLGESIVSIGMVPLGYDKTMLGGYTSNSTAQELKSLQPTRLEPSWEYWMVAAWGLVIVWTTKLYYFDTQPFEDDVHALVKGDKMRTLMGGLPGQLWQHSHAYLTFFLLLMGVALKKLLFHSADHLYVKEAWMLCGSLALALVLQSVQRLTHKQQGGIWILRQEVLRKKGLWSVRLVLIALIILVPLVAEPLHLSPKNVVVSAALVTIAMRLCDVSKNWIHSQELRQAQQEETWQHAAGPGALGTIMGEGAIEYSTGGVRLGSVDMPSMEGSIEGIGPHSDKNGRARFSTSGSPKPRAFSTREAPEESAP